MKYNKEFVDKVKKLYPNSPEMHRHAEQGNAILGRYLDDSSSSTIDIDWLLKQNDIIVIHLKCENMKAKVDLYKEWFKF